MTAERLPGSATEWIEELKADEKLAELDLYEDLAQLWDEEQCPKMREEFAWQYRSLIGVSPDQRDDLRAAMERIKAGGRMPVMDAIDLLRQRDR